MAIDCASSPCDALLLSFSLVFFEILEKNSCSGFRRACSFERSLVLPLKIHPLKRNREKENRMFHLIANRLRLGFDRPLIKTRLDCGASAFYLKMPLSTPPRKLLLQVTGSCLALFREMVLLLNIHKCLFFSS